MGKKAKKERVVWCQVSVMVEESERIRWKRGQEEEEEEEGPEVEDGGPGLQGEQKQLQEDVEEVIELGIRDGGKEDKIKWVMVVRKRMQVEEPEECIEIGGWMEDQEYL